MFILPIAIPFIILLLCLVAFFGLRNPFEKHFKKLEDRTSLLQRVLYLVMTKDIVSFFASPEANKIVDILFDESQKSKDDLEEKLLESVQSAGPEIERLYASLQRAYSPSALIYKSRSASTLLRLNILLYGIVVASSEIVELFVYVANDHAAIFLNGIVFGVTIIFAMALTSMAVYILIESSKIDKHMKKLSDPSLIDSPLQADM